MSHHEALGKVHDYTKEHDRERTLLVREGADTQELSEFVISSIHNLTELFEPVVHDVSKGVEKAKEGSWLSRELGNVSASTWVNPPSNLKLPVRHALQPMIGRRDALMLGTDAGPLKIVTTATRHEEFKESAMRVASYRHATPEQAAAYGEANNVRLTPEDTVIMRRNVVDYYWRVFEGQEEYSCSYTSGIDPEAVHIHSPNAGQSWVYSETGVYPIVRLDDYSLLHKMFMQETRTALAELGYNPS